MYTLQSANPVFLVFRYYLTFDWCYFGTSGTPSFLSFPKHITYFLFCLIFRWRVNAWSCVALINLAEKNAWVFLWPRCGTFLSLVSLVWFNPGVQSSRPPSATFEQAGGGLGSRSRLPALWYLLRTTGTTGTKLGLLILQILLGRNALVYGYTLFPSNF